MKRIIKIITFYDDGTFSESSPSAPFSPMPVMPYPFPPYEATSVCSTCGLKMDGTMGYVCSNPRCPTGLGPITCCTSEK